MSFVKLDDGHRPDSAQVFLDTSIHCCFLKGETLRPRLDWLLSQFSWKGSSSYSKVEYGNVILANAEYYLRKLRELESLARLQEHVSHVLLPQHREKRTWLFSLTKALGRTDKECTRRADASLRRLLKQGTRVIEARCDSLTDGTECHWGKTGLQRRRDGEYAWKTPNCKSTNKACNVDGFFWRTGNAFSRSRKKLTASTPNCSLTNSGSSQESSPRPSITRLCCWIMTVAVACSPTPSSQWTAGTTEVSPHRTSKRAAY